MKLINKIYLVVFATTVIRVQSFAQVKSSCGYQSAILNIMQVDLPELYENKNNAIERHCYAPQKQFFQLQEVVIPKYSCFFTTDFLGQLRSDENSKDEKKKQKNILEFLENLVSNEQE